MRLTIAEAPSEWSRFADGSVERRMLVAIGAELGVSLRPRPLLLEHRHRVEVEGKRISAWPTSSSPRTLSAIRDGA
jgi:hypothetical protein